MNRVARANRMSVLLSRKTHDIDLAPAGSFALTRALPEPHDALIAGCSEPGRERPVFANDAAGRAFDVVVRGQELDNLSAIDLGPCLRRRAWPPGAGGRSGFDLTAEDGPGSAWPITRADA